jgi:Cof subfamily protein (haloacid dehalogenase superfamily)
MIRLVGIDVDGTLVGASGLVDAKVWRAAQRACDAGIHLALCSGRPAFGLALDYAQRLDAAGWHIFQNGASVIHRASGVSQSAQLPTDAVAQLIAQARSTGHVLELYGDKSYVAESNSAWAHEHAALLGVAFEPRSFESLQAPVVRAQWLLAPADATRMMAQTPNALEVAQSSSPLMPHTRFVGLTRKGVNKGSALRTIATQYGVAMQDVMYIGDAGNDVSALQIVGYPIAMGNADAAVIEIAKHTVASADAGGVAEALELAMATHEEG